MCRRRGASIPLILNPRERAPGIYSLGGWVDFRAGVGAVEKRQITCPCWDSNCDSSVLHPAIPAGVWEAVEVTVGVQS